jgi:hypothetical protein
MQYICPIGCKNTYDKTISGHVWYQGNVCEMKPVLHLHWIFIVGIAKVYQCENTKVNICVSAHKCIQCSKRLCYILTFPTST